VAVTDGEMLVVLQQVVRASEVVVTVSVVVLVTVVGGIPIVMKRLTEISRPAITIAAAMTR